MLLVEPTVIINVNDDVVLRNENLDYYLNTNNIKNATFNVTCNGFSQYKDKDNNDNKDVFDEKYKELFGSTIDTSTSKSVEKYHSEKNNTCELTITRLSHRVFA